METTYQIGALGFTMMAGPEENMNAERDFTSLLPEVSNITLSVTNLELTLKSGEKLVFKDDSITDSKLLGKSFRLINFYKYPNTEINISFYGTDNQVSGFSGVNSYRTSYTNIDGNKVKFSDLAMTKKAGPEENMNAEADFSKYIRNAQYMYKKANELIIISDDSTILRFIENYFEPMDFDGKEFQIIKYV